MCNICFSVALCCGMLLCAPIHSMGNNTVERNTLDYARETDDLLSRHQRECCDLAIPLKRVLDDIIRSISYPCRLWNRYFWLSDLVTEANLQRIYNALPLSIQDEIGEDRLSSQESLLQMKSDLVRVASEHSKGAYFWTADCSIVHMVFHSYISTSLAKQELAPLCRTLQIRSGQLRSVCSSFCDLAESFAQRNGKIHPHDVVQSITDALNGACGQDLLHITCGHSAALERLSLLSHMERSMTPEKQAVSIRRGLNRSPTPRDRDISCQSYNTEDSDDCEEEAQVERSAHARLLSRTKSPLDASLSPMMWSESTYCGTTCTDAEELDGIPQFKNFVRVLRSGKEVHVEINAHVIGSNMVIFSPAISIRKICLQFPIERVLLEVDINLDRGRFVRTVIKDEAHVSLLDKDRAYCFYCLRRNKTVKGELKHRGNSIEYDTSEKKVIYKVGSDEYTFHNYGMDAALTGPNDFSVVIDEDSIVLFSLNQTVPYLLPAEKLEAFLQGVSIEKLGLRPLSQEEGEQ